MAETSEPTRRQRKKHATRQALRRCALALALDHGADHVTVEQIAEAADVAPRTFFNYFACKEDALVPEEPESVATALAALERRSAAEAPVDTVREVLKEVAVVHTSPGYRDDALARQRLVDAHPWLLPRQLARYAAFEQALTDALAPRLGVDAKEDLRPRVLAAAGTAALRVAIRRWSDDRDRPVDDYVNEAFAVLTERGDARTVRQ